MSFSAIVKILWKKKAPPAGWYTAQIHKAVLDEQGNLHISLKNVRKASQILRNHAVLRRLKETA